MMRCLFSYLEQRYALKKRRERIYNQKANITSTVRAPMNRTLLTIVPMRNHAAPIHFSTPELSRLRNPFVTANSVT